MKKLIMATLVLSALGCSSAPSRRDALRPHVPAETRGRILIYFHASSETYRDDADADGLMRQPHVLDIVRRSFTFVSVDTGRRWPYNILAEGEDQDRLVEKFERYGVRNADLVVTYKVSPPLLVVTDTEGRCLAEFGREDFRRVWEQDGPSLSQWLYLNGGRV